MKKMIIKDFLLGLLGIVLIVVIFFVVGFVAGVIFDWDGYQYYKVNHSVFDYIATRLLGGLFISLGFTLVVWFGHSIRTDGPS